MIYPFDQTGNAATNRISNEEHSIASVNGQDAAYFYLDGAPFYTESVVVIDVSTGRTLDPNNDYAFGNEYADATQRLGKSVHGMVYFTDASRTGTYRFTYQTVGGPFVTNTTQALQNGLLAATSQVLVDWDQIDPASIPATFPPTDHYQGLSTIQDIQGVISALSGISAAVGLIGNDIRFTDITDLETEFKTPLFALLNSINTKLANIDNLTGVTTVSYKHNPNNVYIVNTPSVDTWLDTVINIDLADDVKWLILNNPQVVVNWSDTANPGKLETRWVLVKDGTVTVPPEAGSASSIITVSNAPVKLRLQYKINKSANSVISSSTEKPSSLIAVKVSS